MDILDITCVIFAGGKSSRMGEDKSLLPFGSFDTLTEFQLYRTKQIFKRVYISTKTRDKFHFDGDFIIDEGEAFAPTAGFVSIFNHIDDERFLALSVDTPFIDYHIFKKLIDNDDGSYDATIAKSPNGTHPLCGIYHRSLESDFIEMLKQDNHRLGKLLSSKNSHFVEFDSDDTFLNLNNPDEYKKAIEVYLNA